MIHILYSAAACLFHCKYTGNLEGVDICWLYFKLFLEENPPRIWNGNIEFEVL